MEYPSNLRAAIYARVSTPNQKERDLSVPEQIDSLRRFCKERGWPVVAEFRDEGISGKNQVRRTEFQRMVNLGMQKDRAFDIILTRDHSRFGRSDNDNAIRNKLREYGCRVDNLDEPHGDMTPEGITLQGRTNERLQTVHDISQREKIGPLVRRSQSKAAEQGRLPGANGMMFGYRSVYEGGGPRPKRRVEPDPVTAPIVRAMFQRYADGESVHSLTKWLNDLAVPTLRNGKLWWAANVRRILTNETVLGRIAYGRTRTVFDPETEMPKHVPSDKDPIRFDGAFPALVSQELFDAVQARLRKNERRRPKGGHPGNLVRGLAYCSKCGWGLAFMKRSGRWYYMCESKKQKGSKADPACRGVLSSSYVQNVVLLLLERLLHVPRYSDMIEEGVRAYNRAAEDHQGLAQVEFVKAQMKSLERKQANLVKAVAEGVELPAIKEALYETESLLSDARKKYNELASAVRSMPKLDERYILDVAKRLRSAIRAKDMPKIKDLLGSMVERIEVDLTKRSMREVAYDCVFPNAAEQQQYARHGGRDNYYRSLQDTLNKFSGEGGKSDLPPGAWVIEQKLPNGERVIVQTNTAPLRFVLKWDPVNLERISEETLKRIGSIAV